MAVRKISEDELDRMVSGFAFPEYEELRELRELIDDCLAGQKTIKEKGKYLPPTGWQKNHLEKYYEFLYRALFPGETKYSLDIYEGLFRLGNPSIQLPGDRKMDYLIEDASVTRDGLKQIQVRLNREQMAHGLRMLLLETTASEDRPFFIQEYGANKFVRAHFNTRLFPGESVADAVVLNESTLENDIQSWSYRKVIRLLVLGLDRNREYYQRSISPEELMALDVQNPPQDERTVYPAYMKKRFNRIPLVWCGATGNSGISMDYPPMLSMAQTELKLFICMAHHSQHIFMNTQESIVITGASNSFKLKDDAFVAGAAVVIPGEHSDAKYISTNGIGFDAEEKEISMLQESIAQERFSLMSAKSHQSGTVVGMVQNSQSGPLRTVVGVSGTAITLILRHMARWMGYAPEEVSEISYRPSQEFAKTQTSLSEFIALCKAVEGGAVKMLESDLYTMARDSQFINSDLPWDRFKELWRLEFEERQRRQGVTVSASGNPFAAAGSGVDKGADSTD